jgi:hypothetical protein
MAKPIPTSGAELAYLRGANAHGASVEDAGTLAGLRFAVGKRVAAKDAHALPALAALLRDVARFERRAPASDRAHFAAARAWLAGEPLQAAGIYTEASAAAPDDLLALRLAQSCWYFLGDRTRVRSVAERALAHWHPAARGADVTLAMAAFGRAETGDGAAATAFAQRALAIEPHSPYAHHALAHGLATQGRNAAAHSALAESAALWRIGGRMDAHNAWHEAVYALALGRRSQALAAFDRDLHAPRDAQTCADATDLLWRLELAGIDTGSRWQPLAAAWARHLSPGFWSFLDVLAGLAFERAGSAVEARALRRALTGTPAAWGTTAAAHAALQALAGIEAFMQGDHVRACTDLRNALPAQGGSTPQRELLALTLAAAERNAEPVASAA